MYNHEACEYAEKFDFENAEKSFLAAIKLQRDYFEAYVGLCFIYIQLDETQKAVAILEKAKLILAKNPIIYSLLGSVYVLNNNEQKALSIWKSAKEMDSELCIDCICELVSMLKEIESYDKAIHILESVIKINPTTNIYGYLAGLKLYNKEYDDIKMIADKIFEIETDSIIGYALLGSSAMTQGDYETAIDLFKKVIKFSPDDMIAYAQLAKTYEMMGKPKEAIECINIIMNHDEVNLDAHLSCAQVYDDLNKKNEAIKVLKNILTIDPTFTEAVDLLLELVIEKQDIKTFKWLYNEILIHINFDINDFDEDIQKEFLKLMSKIS